ncbi:Alcohol acetyltransferase [Microsporum audouinii]
MLLLSNRPENLPHQDGKLEKVSASCHHQEFFNNVGLSAHYILSEPSSPLAGSDLRRLIYAAVGDVIRKHRILFAIPVNEDTPDTYFASLPSIDLNRSITFLERSQPFDASGEDEELDAILESQHNTNFKSEYGTLPFWRLIILQNRGAEKEFTASFIYHHAIGDGVSGLVFHAAFRNALEAASPDPKVEDIVIPDEDTLVPPPLEELHPLPINPTPPSPSTAALKEWTGNFIRMPCKTRWKSLCFSPDTSKAFFQECKANNQSVTSGLSSIIAMALFSALGLETEALTCIIPVNLRPWLKLPCEVGDGAIGSYFDATRVQFTRPRDPGATDVWPGAQQASKAMKDYLQNVSPSGEPYTAVAIFQTIPDVSAVFASMLGKPRDAALEVTNVGRFSSSATGNTADAPLWQVGKVILSRSSLVAGAAVTASVATGENGSMTLGFSWQDGVVQDGLLCSISQGVKKYFEKYE